MIKKMIYFIYFFIYLIGLIFVSLLGGSVIGIIGKAVAHFEDFTCLMLKEYWLWKRFPKFNYNKYIKTIINPILFSSVSRKMDYWDIINYEQNIRIENPLVPLPIIKIIVIFIIGIFIFPIRLFIGVAEGSMLVFESGLLFFRDHFFCGKSVVELIFGKFYSDSNKYELEIEKYKNEERNKEIDFCFL